MSKRRRKKKIKVGPIILLLIVVFVVIGYFIYNSRPKLQVVSIVSKIEKYDYYLEDNATNIYKDNYNKLEKELKDNKVDEENYAKLVGKLFVIDYYTLNNKITNKDIGGVQFIHSNLKSEFVNKASNTIYKYVKNDLYGNRKQSLPEVKSVDVQSIEDNKFTVGETEYDGYKIKLNIEYIEDLGYDKDAEIIIIKQDKYLYIVEKNNIEQNK